MKKGNKHFKEDEVDKIMSQTIRAFSNKAIFGSQQQIEHYQWSANPLTRKELYPFIDSQKMQVNLSNIQSSQSPSGFPLFKLSESVEITNNEENSKTSLSSAFTSDNETGNDLASDEEFSKEFVSKKRTRTKKSSDKM